MLEKDGLVTSLYQAEGTLLLRKCVVASGCVAQVYYALKFGHTVSQLKLKYEVSLLGRPGRNRFYINPTSQQLPQQK